MESTDCPEENITFYPSILGVELIMPEWEAIVTAVVLTIITLLTIVGNILVVISVLTCRRLRVPQNFFIVSLAVADLTVAILVLPFNIVYSIIGRWNFGIYVCKIWLTSDILCCTASILNLCAVALDRYWAITDPISYAQQRTAKRVIMTIAGVWVVSGIISSPPLLGWNSWKEDSSQCELTLHQGYVVYSSLGSFYIPLFIMTTVYMEIFIATKRRLRRRATMAQRYTVALPQVVYQQPQVIEQEVSLNRTSFTSETSNYEKKGDIPEKTSGGICKQKRKGKTTSFNENVEMIPIDVVGEESITDIGNSSSSFQESAGPRSPAPSSPAPSSTVGEVKKGTQMHSFMEEKQRISLSRERRAARTLGIIMSVFVVCWLPFFLLYVIPASFVCGWNKFRAFVTWLGYINSALNPIIYTIFNLDFRRAMKKLLHIK